jgi:transcriptional regulator of arginine metabolism
MIKTYPGGAHAVAAIIDELQWPEMMGSIAGDDAILVITRAEQPRPTKPEGPTGVLYERIEELIKG